MFCVVFPRTSLALEPMTRRLLLIYFITETLRVPGTRRTRGALFRSPGARSARVHVLRNAFCGAERGTSMCSGVNESGFGWARGSRAAPPRHGAVRGAEIGRRERSACGPAPAGAAGSHRSRERPHRVLRTAPRLWLCDSLQLARLGAVNPAAPGAAF